MKHHPRPFVVEVKRGTSRQSFQSHSLESDKFSAAEKLLFSDTRIERVFDTASPMKPGTAGRVLPVLSDVHEIVLADPFPAPRRGPSPGLKEQGEATRRGAGCCTSCRAPHGEYGFERYRRPSKRPWLNGTAAKTCATRICSLRRFFPKRPPRRRNQHPERPVCGIVRESCGATFWASSHEPGSAGRSETGSRPRRMSKQEP